MSLKSCPTTIHTLTWPVMELFKKQQQMSNLKRLNVGFIIGFDTVQFIILFIVNKIVDDWI